MRRAAVTREAEAAREPLPPADHDDLSSLKYTVSRTPTQFNSLAAWNQIRFRLVAGGSHATMASSLFARLRTTLLNDSIGVSRSAAGVEDPRCNIVHLKRRPPAPLLAEQARRAADEWTARSDGGDSDARPRRRRLSAVLRPGREREDAHGLVTGWMAERYPELADAIVSDCELLAGMVTRATAGGGGGDGQAISARLEALDTQPCPKWHADTVGARALVTFAGKGTQYLPNNRVRRGWDSIGAPVVAGVRVESGGSGAEQHRLFEQAGAWDVLVLKGHACPGMAGMGAVHRSPPVVEDEEDCCDEQGEQCAAAEDALAPAASTRLVLTVDDACECCPTDDNERIEGAVALR